MSNKLKSLRFIAAPAILAVAAGMGASGCSDSGLPGATCEGEAKVQAFLKASNAFVTVTGDIEADLIAICNDFNDKLDGEQSDDMETACANASAALDTAFEAAGQFTIEVAPPSCKVNASASLNCTADCKVEADCQANVDVSASCMGSISGKCDAECTGTVTCEGSASVAASCEGSCDGTCVGECDAMCEGSATAGEGGEADCNGKCMGKCTGECKGNCELAADASVMCSGEATCTGECSVEFEEPSCEGTLDADVGCEVDGECSAACESEAEFNAECQPGGIVITGDIDANLALAVEANLPKLKLIAETRATAVLEAGQDVVGGLEGLVSAGGECIIAFGGQITGAASAAGSAVGNVQASASVSVDVSASASGMGSAG